MVKRTDKTARYRKGLWAERFCALYLFCRGWRIVARRFKTPQGEIDLIAARGGTVAFIEVKARNTETQGGEAVRPTAMRRIENAARLFLAERPQLEGCDLRFDVMIVTSFRRWPRWHQNAWQSGS